MMNETRKERDANANVQGMKEKQKDIQKDNLYGVVVICCGANK